MDLLPQLCTYEEGWREARGSTETPVGNDVRGLAGA